MRYVFAEGLVVKRAGESLLVHREATGDFVVVNRTGAEVWLWIGEGATTEDIRRRFTAKYGDRENDLRTFLGKLESSGLARRTDE